MTNTVDSTPGISRRQLLQRLAMTGVGLSCLPACAPLSSDQAKQPDMGLVVKRSSPHYEQWRANLAWHSFVSERRPELMVRPETPEQVIEAVNYARENNLTISCKSGGHNYYQSWMRQDCLLLDMYNFRDVEIDAAAQTAWVGPSLWGSTLSQALNPHGLAFPVSTCLSVPMGGYIMGGGIGFGWQDWGMACESVLAVEVVTAEGKRIIASPDNHPDLYWAARGGVAGFPGVVLRWKLRVYPDPKVMQINGSFYSLNDMQAMLDALQPIAMQNLPGWHAQVVLLPTSMAKAVMLPPEKAAKVTIEDKYICLLETYVHADTEAETRRLRKQQLSAPVFKRAVAEVENVGTGLLSIYEDMKGREITHVNQQATPIWTNQPGEALQRLSELLESNTADLAYGALLLNGREMKRDDACFSMGSKGYGSLSIYGLWFTDNEQGVTDWHKKVTPQMMPLAEGRYVNETDCFRNPELVSKAYTPENWQKLQRVNKAYDPDGLFHTFPGFKETELKGESA